MLSRRDFVKVSAMGGLACTLPVPKEPPSRLGDLLVVVHLRGGCDGLHILAPCADPAVVARDRALGIPPRPGSLRVPAVESGWDWRLHPDAAPLAPLFHDGSMIALPRFGAAHQPRGHLDARQRMARGLEQPQGWLAATFDSHMAITPGHPPLDVCGMPACVLAPSPCTLIVRNAHAPGRVIEHAAGACPSDPHPAIEIAKRLFGCGGGDVPKSGISLAFSGICAALSDGLDVAAAVIEDGGWDTHEHQGSVLERKVAALSESLGAFWRDLRRLGNQECTRVLVVSEFGRRLSPQTPRGTDHGHAGLALLLGAGGDGVRGTWRALETPESVVKPDPNLLVAQRWWKGALAHGAALPREFGRIDHSSVCGEQLA